MLVVRCTDGGSGLCDYSNNLVDIVYLMPSFLHRHTRKTGSGRESPPSETLSLSPPPNLPVTSPGSSVSGEPKSILRPSNGTFSSSSSLADLNNGFSALITSSQGASQSEQRSSFSLSNSSSDQLKKMDALTKTNVLQFINIKHSTHKPVLHAVQDSWPHGISRYGYPKNHESGTIKTDGGETKTDVWEVEMKGMVWGSRGVRDSVAVRRLMSELLSALSKEGYILCAAIDAGIDSYSKDTLYLKYSKSPASEIPTRFFSMAFQEDSKIWLIDAPQAVINSVEEHVNYAWPQGIKHSHTLAKEPGCHELKLKGSPWVSGSGSHQISSRLLHLHLLRAVYTSGFQLKGSVALADKDEGEMDSLFFETRIDLDST
ncbi:hypothetical protein [Phaffia rhodozyma]|uniref:Uncharacterized protein n=1 Tax=Phaffia rhodozyma TaxID=264483 RepID=A0A0F7SQL9_PHARH|nr:hypothetical protein [Phaffia rhodozyma]